MFNPEIFKMRDWVLMFTKAANQNWTGAVWGICLPESMSIRSVEFMLFFMLSARQKICFLNGRCDTCLTKEWSMPVRAKDHVPSLKGVVGEKHMTFFVSASHEVESMGTG